MDNYLHVECLLCNKTMQILNTHLKFKHGMTVDAYIAMYPGAKYFSQAMHDKYSINNPRKNPEVSKRAAKTFSDKFKTGELVSWRKNQTKDTHPGLARQAEKLTGRTKETHEGVRRSSEFMLRNNPAKRPEVRKKISDKLKGRVFTAEWIDNLRHAWTRQSDSVRSERMRKLLIGALTDDARAKWLESSIENGTLGCRGKKFKRGEIFSNKSNILVRYASSFEQRYIELAELNSSIASFDRCKWSLPYHNGIKFRRYVPDFKIVNTDGSVCIIEVKPLCFVNYPLNIMKAIAAKEYCAERGWQYVIVTEKELWPDAP